MIRDEFIKQRKEKKLSARVMEKIRTMGERAYYVTEMNKLTNLKKTLNFSMILLGVLSGIVTLTMLIPFMIYKKFVSDMVTPIIVLSVCWLIFALWYAVILPAINRKIRKYTAEYENVKQREIEKQKAIYKNMNK